MPANVVSGTIRGGLYTRVVGRRFLFFQELPSTMDEAARQAKSGADEGLVVVAERQTAGRGRFGRTWVSRPGNLYLSVLLRPSLDTLPLVSILGGVAVARAIRKTTGLEPGVKWPNDVLLRGKKAAGILVESAVSGEQVQYAVLGIGINVGLEVGEIPDISAFATSLNAEAGPAVSREDVLRQLLQDLDALYLQAAQGRSPLGEWRGLLETLGQRVRVSWRDESYVGVAEDVDQLGNLQLRLDDGRLVTVTAGDVTLAADR